MNQILRGLGGADANRMTSQTLEITKTRTLEEIIAGGDNALALSKEEECALALAFNETVSNYHSINMIMYSSSLTCIFTKPVANKICSL